MIFFRIPEGPVLGPRQFFIVGIEKIILFCLLQFLHLVTNVRREENNWRVKYKNVITGEEFQEVFDYVFICTGHYSKPNKPVIPGEKKFKGAKS